MVTTATPKLTIPSPSMVHYRGGRAAIDPTSTPSSTRSGPTWPRPTGRGAPRSAELGLHLPAVRRHEPRLSERPGPARATSPRRAATPSTSTRSTSGPSTTRSRAKPDIDVDHHAHVPRQLPLVVGGRGRLRLRRRGAVRGAGRRRLLPRVRRRALGRLRAAAVRAARASRSCSGWSRPSAASSRTRTTLKRRIDEASRYVPLDQLCLSPQCGFSSTVEGNVLTYDEEVAKLRLVVEIAAEVWG